MQPMRWILILLLLPLAGCNHLTVEPQPDGVTINVYQSAWKSASGTNNAIEATTESDANLGLK